MLRGAVYFRAFLSVLLVFVYYSMFSESEESMQNQRRLILYLLSMCLWSAGFSSGSAHCDTGRNTSGDKNADRKRVQLAHIRRVVVIPPFFGTDTILRATPPPGAAPPHTDANEPEPPPKANDARPLALGDPRNPIDPKLTRYAEQLRKLQDAARAYLPQRLAKRAGFEVVPPDETANALRALGLTPEKMFMDDGRVKNTHFPLPLPDAIRKVSEALRADAVVLGVLDEPRRANGKYMYDPLYGFSYEPGFAEAHAGFYLMLPEGTEALHGYMRVRNPTSREGRREFVLADWADAQDLMIENLMDEWTYYTPKKP